MLKRIHNLLKEDDAVSPVIGVILMVAITVILAAVIASFVLGLGDTSDDIQPNTSFSLEYDAMNVDTDTEAPFNDEIFAGDDDIEDNSSYDADTLDGGNHQSDFDSNVASEANGFLTVSVTDGESVQASEMYLRGEGLFTVEGEEGELNFAEDFDLDAGEELSAGQSVTLVVNSDFDVNVVWEGSDSDSSSTLAEREGPDA